MATKKEDAYSNFYLKLIRETSQGVLNEVCKRNSISVIPTDTSDLCPIPIFETDRYSLLNHANIQHKTKISFVTDVGYEYLPAYFKKYKTSETPPSYYKEIVVRSPNYCDARFFAAKELMHCFIDDDGISASNSIPLVNELLEQLSVSQPGFFENKPQSIVDQVAFLGALEFLIPTSWIPILKRLYEHICDKNVISEQNSYLYLAQLIRVPQNVLKFRLKNPN